MKTFKLISFILVILTAAFVSSGAAEMEVATVDVDNLFDNYERTIQLNEKIEEEIKGKQAERDSLVEDIRRMKDEMVLLADDNQEEKQEEIDQRIRELQELDEKTREELADKRNQYMREILEELDVMVQKYGEEKGFDYILNSKLLLYNKDKYDVTEDLLKRINDEFSNK